MLTLYLKVAATVNKLLRTEFQLAGNFNNGETNAVVELVDVLTDGVSMLCGYNYLQG